MDSISSYDRVRAYIDNVYLVLDKLREKGVDKKYPKLFEAVELYAKDAEYYLVERKDLFTALACIAYAEGLVDSLRYLGLEDVEWESLEKLLSRPKVLVAGCFEILHPGHIHYLREAWRIGRVYVVVARDSSVIRFKGRKPVVPEGQRRDVLESIRYVYRVVLGDKRDYLKPVLDIKPDIILLGPDQRFSEEVLSRELSRRGLEGVVVKRLSERIDKDLYSTSRIIDEIVKRYCRS